jgi:hypothetical protein
VTRSAIAGKMVFAAAPSTQSLDLHASFQRDQGLLTLSPEGTVDGPLRLELVAAAKRAPAGLLSDSSRFHPFVLKSMPLTRPVSIELPRLTDGQALPSTIQIRVLAP